MEILNMIKTQTKTWGKPVTKTPAPPITPIKRVKTNYDKISYTIKDAKYGTLSIAQKLLENEHILKVHYKFGRLVIERPCSRDTWRLGNVS